MVAVSLAFTLDTGAAATLDVSYSEAVAFRRATVVAWTEQPVEVQEAKVTDREASVVAQLENGHGGVVRKVGASP